MEGDIVIVPTTFTGVQPGLPKIGPKDIGHPTVGGVCLLCQEVYVVGDYTTLLPLGPGASEDSRKLARAGEPYEGIAVEAHWSCATGEPDVELIIP